MAGKKILVLYVSLQACKNFFPLRREAEGCHSHFLPCLRQTLTKLQGASEDRNIIYFPPL